MALVPRQIYQVLHIAPKETAIEDKPDVTAWVKRTTINPTHPFAIWSNGDTSQLTTLYPDLPSEVSNGYRNCGIAVGRAVINNSIDIATAGGEDLPRFLFRATHGGQPHLGLKSRGQNGAPGQYFAIQFMLHLNWNARVESPFMSWTSRRSTARYVAAMYEARGFKDIKIHMTDTRGEGWDRERQRIWDLGLLVNTFDIIRLGVNHHENEYAIENSVPEQATTTTDWEEVQKEMTKEALESLRAKASLKKKTKEQVKEEKQEKKAALKIKLDAIKATAEEKGVSLETAARMVRQSEGKIRKRMKGHKRLLQRAN